MELINLKDEEVFKKEGRGMANVIDEPYLFHWARLDRSSAMG